MAPGGRVRSGRQARVSMPAPNSTTCVGTPVARVATCTKDDKVHDHLYDVIPAKSGECYQHVSRMPRYRVHFSRADSQMEAVQ